MDWGSPSLSEGGGHGERGMFFAMRLKASGMHAHAHTQKKLVAMRPNGTEGCVAMKRLRLRGCVVGGRSRARRGVGGREDGDGAGCRPNRVRV